MFFCSSNPVTIRKRRYCTVLLLTLCFLLQTLVLLIVSHIVSCLKWTFSHLLVTVLPHQLSNPSAGGPDSRFSYTERDRSGRSSSTTRVSDIRAVNEKGNQKIKISHIIGNGSRNRWAGLPVNKPRSMSVSANLTYHGWSQNRAHIHTH